MALKRTKLLHITPVTGISTVGIFTAGITTTPVGTTSTSYIRSVVMHSTGLSTATASLYVYPSNVSISGVGQTGYRLIRYDISANETLFTEFNYPLVLTNGDTLVVEVTQPSALVGGLGIGTAINVQVFGDTDI
jgi:hypothetical protein